MAVPDDPSPAAIGRLQPDTARRIVRWQMLFFAVLLSLFALANTYTVIADRAREGVVLPPWQPAVWEISSNFVIWLLIPAMAWWLQRFPVRQNTWRSSVPAHLLVTAPYSLAHAGGMIALRELAYAIAGTSYRFGPFWDNWIYEYRKDFLTYFVILGGLLGFRLYGLWLDTRTLVTGAAADPVMGANPLVGADAAAIPAGLPSRRLVVRKRNREFILDAAEIDRVDSDGNYVVVHAAGETYRLRDSLEGINRRLGEQRFVRVHRAHVVNIDRIREIQPWDHGDYRIVLKDGSFLNFSRRYRTRLSHLFR
jgi:hypothetical protein